MNLPLPPASIIINTYNRGAWLDDALRGLAGLDYPEFEVIVVNGPSTDNSAEVIARWDGQVKALTCDAANLAISRNVGIAAADGAIIAFIDDDAVPHPQWLRRLAVGFRDAEVGAMGGFTVETSGTRWQVRKTVCDRFGNAHEVTDFFDERPLNRPGSPFYPSLLGTNSAFRAKALRAIGGFDHAFAYLLDETDVCLRLVDAGWHVRYEPQALVWHQYARSHIRDGERVARTVYPSSLSRAYFALRHGGAADLVMAGERIDSYRQEILASNAWLERHGQITAEHRHSLDQDVLQGIEQGRRLAMTCGAKPGGDLAAVVPQVPTPFLRFEPTDGRRIVLVSQGWPPENDTGIARWTALVARGLVARGHKVHVLTRAAEGMPETVRFEDGLWLHRLAPADPLPGDPAYESRHAGTAPVPDPEGLDAAAADMIAARHGLPRAMASWPARVWREVQFLKSFGVELLSFPIWDVEGIALLDDPDLVTVVSLHTTYAMAAPHRPDWIERPLLAARHVAPMIAAETAVLASAPLCLANSHAIVGEVLRHHGIDLAQRAVVVPHGTPDPLTTRAAAAALKMAEALDHAPLDVLFVGRFEPRKGFDITLRVARAVLAMPNLTMTFVGGVLDDAALAQIAALDVGAILDHPRIRFAGTLDRDALDDAYVAADVVLMPSRFESFGLVAIEAMAAGRPVLALDGGGLGEVARADCGARAFADSPDVADRISAELAWLDADREELTQRMRQARAGWAMHYSADAMVRGIEAFAARALGEAEKRARLAAGIVQIGPPDPVAPPPSPRRRSAGEAR